MAGTVGAIFNGALQLGSAIGLAAFSSIETSTERKQPNGFEHYQGRSAGFLFVLAVVCAEALSILVFYKERGEKGCEHSSRSTISEGMGEIEKAIKVDV